MHETEVGKLKIELKQNELELTNNSNEIKRMGVELSNFAVKVKKYDEISAQGVKSMIQNRAYTERASVR